MNTPTVAAIASAITVVPIVALAQADRALDSVVVSGRRMSTAPLGATTIDEPAIAARRGASSDTSRLLQDAPGVGVYSAGGVSGLPVIRGLADDRLRILVDDMDLAAACANHMNSPLSYIDPTRVGSITVFAGITPVSVGGDSIGGTIQVNSPPPEFAGDAEPAHAKGRVGAFFRSNGNARGIDASATFVGQDLNVSYSGSSAQSSNYIAGRGFKPAGPGAAGGRWLDADTVGSSGFTARNHDLGVALRHDRHTLRLNVGVQRIPFEGFPNQRMDMTGNDSTQVNLRYWGQFDWGRLQARAYRQATDHTMNMGPDRFSYGTDGMPMNTRAKNRGATLQGEFTTSESSTFRIGAEAHAYTLYDGWPPAGGVMGPRTFWNVDYGTRRRTGVYGEWEALWGEQWVTQFGVRTERVTSNAGPVQGYNAQPIWADDAAAFNASERKRADTTFDLTALARYTPDATRTFDVGFARKSRAPNLYQRYAWSTQPMATLMNNFVGDGNGYVGDVGLKPEVAHTFSVGADWHDADAKRWRLKSTGYVTFVDDYIDARRCTSGQCGGAANATATTGFVNLQYANQSARLHGFDVSGHVELGTSENFGAFRGSGVLSYVRGANRTTGDDLYHMMPLNTKLALAQQWGAWTNTAELQLVSAKTRVSQVRNEMPTTGYGLLNLRSSVEYNTMRVVFGIENVFNRFYAPPLGGAYLGQGASMSSTGIAWGVPLPGMGRSVNVSLSVSL